MSRSTRISPRLPSQAACRTLTITLTNPNNAPLTEIKFSDTMPTGMYLYTPPTFSTTGGSIPCGGQLSGAALSNTFYYDGVNGDGSKVQLAANVSCTMTMLVLMDVNGNLTNTIPIGSVTSYSGASNQSSTQVTLHNDGGVSLPRALLPTSWRSIPIRP